MTGGGKPDSIIRRFVQDNWKIIVGLVFTAGMMWSNLQLKATSDIARIERIEKQTSTNSDRIADLEKLAARQDEINKMVTIGVDQMNRKLDRLLFFHGKEK